jgi:hypothetical protein
LDRVSAGRVWLRVRRVRRQAPPTHPRRLEDADLGLAHHHQHGVAAKNSGLARAPRPGRREEFWATKARRFAAGGADFEKAKNAETETRTAWSPTATHPVAGPLRIRRILVHVRRRRALCHGSQHELDHGRTGQEQDRLPEPNYVNDQDNITSPAECEPTCHSNDLHPGMSCKRARVEVLDYLADVLVRVAAHPASKIDQLLPMSRAKGSLSRRPRRPSRKPRSSWMQAAPLDAYATTGDANSTMTSLAQHDGQDAADSTVVYAASSSSVLAGEASPFACLGTSRRRATRATDQANV